MEGGVLLNVCLKTYCKIVLLFRAHGRVGASEEA